MNMLDCKCDSNIMFKISIEIQSVVMKQQTYQSISDTYNKS